MARLVVILLTVLALLRPAPMLAATSPIACDCQAAACCPLCSCTTDTLAACCCKSQNVPPSPQVPPPNSGERPAVQWHTPSPGIEIAWPRPAHWPLYRIDAHVHGRTHLPEGGRSLIGSWVV